MSLQLSTVCGRHGQHGDTQLGREHEHFGGFSQTEASDPERAKVKERKNSESLSYTNFSLCL